MKTKGVWRLGQSIALCAGLALALGITACNDSGHHGDPYDSAWYDVYGHYCNSGNPRPGCNFYWDGTKIRDYEDRYFDSDYELNFSWWFYTDSYGYSRDYIGWGWLSPTGILYDEWGNALNQAGNEEGTDAVAEVIKQEENFIERIGENYAKIYTSKGHPLNPEAGAIIARGLNDWKAINKDRSRTEKDVAVAANKIYGVDVDEALVALASAQEGDQSALFVLNDKVANYWGTTPETSMEIIKNHYKDYLSEYGVK